MNKNNSHHYHPHSKLIFILLGILLLVACDGSNRINSITISSSPDINVVENRTDTGHTVKTQGQLLRLVLYTLTGGADQSHFNINQFTGELSFKTPQDFEAPTDNDNNNTYQVEITVSDNVNTATQPLTVTVTDEFDFRIASTDVKTIEFAWSAFSTPLGNATFYRLLVNPDGESGFSLLQDNIVDVNHRINVPVHLTDWVNASYMLEAYNSMGRLNTTPAIAISDAMLTMIGYFKASNTNARDEFGGAISLSGDGTTLAVGARLEDSSFTQQANNSSEDEGAVYVFKHNGVSWSQQAYIKASNTERGAQFGSTVSLSNDGATLAVGAPGYRGRIGFIPGDPHGAVYVFKHNGVSWSQQAYINASNKDTGDSFGGAVSLSSDGATLAVGVPGEDSDATGVNPADPAQAADNTKSGAGAVYVFTRSDVSWRQQAYIKASNTDEGDRFGGAVSLSSDGATLAVGASGEDSDATGVNPADPAQEDNTESEDAGAVYVFTRSDVSWRQQAYIKASNTDKGDRFGGAVSLSSDGATLAVGASGEDSDATGVNPADPAQEDNTESEDAGAVYVFTRSDVSWRQQAYIKASNTDKGDRFGGAVSLSSDGTTLAVGARLEGSNARNINAADPAQTENTAEDAGAVYVFTRSDVSWRQQAYIKASNTDAFDSFGSAVSLSSDGTTLAVGADGESSIATGVNAADPAQANNSTEGTDAGAVYVY